MSARDVFNTPGYYYFLGYWISALMLTFNYNKKEMSKSGRLALHVGLFAFLLVFMTGTDGVRQVWFLPSMLVIIGTLFVYIRIVCGFSMRESGFYCVKAFISGEFAASLCWQIYYFFLGRFSEKYQDLWKWTEMLIVYALVFTCLYLAEKYLKDGIEEIRISRRELFVAILIAAAVFSVSNMSYIDRDGLFSGRLAMDIFIIRTVVDISGMAILYAYHVQVKELQLRFEKDTLQNIMDTQYRNYQISQESIDLVNQKYHDLKHQITLLKAESGTEKSIRYLEQMEREIKIYETQNKTGNKVLDAVLASKSLYCQNHGIELKFMIQGELLCFMDDMDISALFGNMLENAIESVEKLEEEARMVNLYVTQEKQFLCIRTENYCREAIQFKNGMPITTKKDKRLHGYGMKSICSTVEKYGGSAMADLQDNWFRLRILIPLRSR